MYSPDISQHSPCLYRLGQHYGVPMTVLADRMIRFGLKNLEQIMPEKPVLDTSVIALVAVNQPSVGSNHIIRKTAFSLAANKGLVVLLGDTGSPGSQTLTSDVIIRGLRLVGSHDGHNAPEWNSPVSAGHFFTFLRDSRFSVKNLNTHFFKPEACKEAYTLASEDRLRTMGILFDWTNECLWTLTPA